MVSVPNLISGLAFALSFVGLIYTIYKTRKIGPNMALYNIGYESSGFIHEDKTFYIRVTAYAENIGDKAVDLFYQPTITIFDDQDNVICTEKDFTLYEMNVLLSKGIPISNPETITCDIYLPKEAQQGKKAVGKFNAYYFRKRFCRKTWKEVHVKKDEFVLELK